LKITINAVFLILSLYRISPRTLKVLIFDYEIILSTLSINKIIESVYIY